MSVITPTYNAGEYLRDTIDVVRRQTYSQLEHIVVDGGSSDETLSILEKERHERLHWWSEPDEGQADALRRGFALAHGDILGWLNADDVYLHDNVIARVVEEFEANASIDIVTGGGAFLSADGTLIRAIPAPIDLTIDQLRRIDVMLQPATFFRRCVLESTDFDPSLHFAFDWDFFIRAVEGHEVRVLDETLAGYRLHQRSKTVAGGSRRIQELAEVTQRYLGARSPQYRVLLTVARIDRRVDKLPASFQRPARRVVYGGILRLLRSASRGRLQT